MTMFSTSSKLVCASVVLCALNACTTAANGPRLDTVLSEQTGQNGRACIRTSDIRGYGIDDDVININAGRKYYVATTLYHCHDLDLAPQALFDSRFSEACGGSSYIVTRESRCPIKHIFEFENRKQAFAAVDKAEARIKELKEEGEQTEK